MTTPIRTRRMLAFAAAAVLLVGTALALASWSPRTLRPNASSLPRVVTAIPVGPAVAGTTLTVPATSSAPASGAVSVSSDGGAAKRPAASPATLPAATPSNPVGRKGHNLETGPSAETPEVSSEREVVRPPVRDEDDEDGGDEDGGTKRSSDGDSEAGH